MKNDGDYNNQLFFGQSRVSQGWRSETLSKARVKLEIGIIQPKEGRRALGESSYMAARSAMSLPRTLFVYLMMLQLMLQLVK
jgi:hypothetical protein